MISIRVGSYIQTTTHPDSYSHREHGCSHRSRICPRREHETWRESENAPMRFNLHVLHCHTTDESSFLRVIVSRGDWFITSSSYVKYHRIAVIQ